MTELLQTVFSYLLFYSSTGGYINISNHIFILANLSKHIFFLALFVVVLHIQRNIQISTNLSMMSIYNPTFHDV